MQSLRNPQSKRIKLGLLVDITCPAFFLQKPSPPLQAFIPRLLSNISQHSPKVDQYTCLNSYPERLSAFPQIRLCILLLQQARPYQGKRWSFPSMNPEHPYLLSFAQALLQRQSCRRQGLNWSKHNPCFGAFS